MKKRKFRKRSKPVRSVSRENLNISRLGILQISRIKTLGNSRGLSSPPVMRLPRNNQNLKFSLIPEKSSCQKRQERRRALFRLGMAGKIKVRYAKWTKKSLERC